MNRRIQTTAGLLVALSLLSVTAGCNLMALPFMLWGQKPTKDVAAEYPYLEGKRVGILVWAELETLFEYPHVQYEVAEHARAALEAHVKDVKIVSSRKLVDYQRREPKWESQHPTEIGRQFGCERIIMIELTQYTTREPDSPHLYRGRIAANVKVYDCAIAGSAPTYSDNVEVAWPPDTPGKWGADDNMVRRYAMEAFAEELAGRFYDRKVPLQ